MRLISCSKCGVILDTDRMPEPEVYTKEGEIDHSKAQWNGEEFKPVIECPVCKTLIFMANGDI